MKPIKVLASIAAMLLITVPVAQAKKKAITLSLAKRYTVIALAKNGKASSAEKKGKVALVPKASNVTLHLVNSDGTYAAMVVTGKAGKKQVSTCVKAGASLGRLKVRSSGYATPSKKQRGPFACSAFKAKAKNGKPIGAGVFGRVKSKSKGSGGAGKDRDLDGLPGAFDVDDDGDLVLDNFEKKAGGASLASFADEESPGPPGPPAGDEGQVVRVFSNLKVSMDKSVNANASSVTDTDIDNLVSQNQTLAIMIAAGGAVELNCTGLSYCSPGGSGKNMSTGVIDPNAAPAFPDASDADGDGFGTIEAGITGDFQLFTGARSSEIGSGDTFVEIVTSSSDSVTEVPGVLNFAFVTVPALQTWSTSAGSGTIVYPVPSNAPGTLNNGIPVPADGKVTLNFWRPQRKAIPGSGEGTNLVDIGKLLYTISIPNEPIGAPPSGGGPHDCKISSYSAIDPNLKAGDRSLEDQVDDQPSDSANSLTLTIDINDCLGSISWTSGQVLGVDITASTQDSDNAAQKIYFTRS